MPSGRNGWQEQMAIGGSHRWVGEGEGAGIGVRGSSQHQSEDMSSKVSGWKVGGGGVVVGAVQRSRCSSGVACLGVAWPTSTISSPVAPLVPLVTPRDLVGLRCAMTMISSRNG